MRIIQLTDLHIGSAGEKPYGVDVRKNFLDVINNIKSQAYDLLVLSGDLCYQDPDLEVYNWIKTELAVIKQPIIVMAGNHDSNEMISSTFHANERTQYYFKQTFNKLPIYFLDSAPGIVDEDQLTWLTNEMKEVTRDIILFIHHPIGLAGVPHMDKKYALENYTSLQKILHTQPYNVYAFCGHYHLEKHFSIDNLHNFITPSTFFQIDDRFDHFTIASHRVGYRQIDWDGEKLFTKVRFLS